MVSAPNLYRQSHTRSMTTHRQNLDKPIALLTALFTALTFRFYQLYSIALAILDAALN